MASFAADLYQSFTELTYACSGLSKNNTANIFYANKKTEMNILSNLGFPFRQRREGR